ncbi:MAG: HAMP domain-containing histidine kinase [Chloroflexia bacterium]|nr:HAMP domain-containing histidine kinase [Chloroflexia bacterium]
MARARLPSISIRARLTAWYAVLLAALLLVLGIFVFRLVEERLYAETAERLRQTAADVRKGLAEQRPDLLVAWDRDGGRPTLFFAQDLKPYGGHGQFFVQVIDTDYRVINAAPYSPEEVAMFPGALSWSAVRPELATARVNGMETRILAEPIVITARGTDHVVGAILVGVPLQGLHDSLGALRQTLALTSGAGLLLAMVGGWLLADRALRPVDRVTAAAAKIAAGDGSAASLSSRLAVPASGDELARLSATFNEMLDRLEASFHAQQRFVADASHELRTPLTAVRGNVDVLARQVAAHGDQVGNGDVAAALDDMQRESARMGRLVDDLLLLARSDGSDPSEPGNGAAPRLVDLRELASDALRSAAGLADGQELVLAAPRPVTIQGDPDRLAQLLLILLDNAVRHTPAGKRITVAVGPPVADLATLAVRDEGEGIAPEHVPYVFDRFYRADGARGRATGGTGLGLAIARVIARRHGGDITVRSEPGQGSEFVVSLPVRPDRLQ